MTIILGIDPGTRVTGYGIIKVEGSKYIPIDYGAIRPPIKAEAAKRYLVIHESVCALIERYQPQYLSVETQFVHKNVQSALKLGMARGVILIAAEKYKVRIAEYAPTKAKLAVVGNGRASKQQVQGMVRMLLGLSQVPQPEDAADALALAICHAQSLKSPLMIG